MTPAACRPRPARRAWCVLWAACLLLAAPGAQAPRERLVGSARTAAGGPWAGAEVVLVARPIPWRTDLGALDRVAVPCDADGRFVAELLPTLMYSAWVRSSGADEAERLSGLREDVAVGETPVLVERAAGHRARRLVVQGHEAWRGGGPLSARVVAATANLYEQPLALGADGTARLVPQPGDACHLELLVGEQVVAVAPIAWTEGAADDLCIVLPPPRAVRLRVQDAAGAPLPGATVRAGCVGYAWCGQGDNPFAPLRQAWTTPVRASDRGELVVRVPWPEAAPAPAAAFEVTAPGSVVRVVALPAGAVSEGLAVQAAGGEFVVTVRLPAGAQVTGTVLGVDGAPAVGLGLDVACLCRALVSGRSGPCYQLPIPVRTDARGRFVLSGLEPGQAFQVWALTGDLALALPAARGVRAPAVCLLRGGPTAATAVELPAVRLAQLQRLELRATTGEGAPAESPRVHFGMRDAPGGVADNLHRHQWWCGDRKGQLALLVPPLAADLLVHTPAGLGGFTTFLPGEEPTSSPVVLRCTVAPALAVSGRVLDQGGRPVAGAALGMALLREGATPESWRSRQALYELQDRWLSGHSDAEGRFALRFLPMPSGHLLLRVRQGPEFQGSQLRLDTEPVRGAELVIDVAR